MVPFILFALKKFREILRRNLIRVTILLIVVLIYGTFSEYLLEHGAPGSGISSLFDSLWFVVQTITTVGYGEIQVVTFGGRINAMGIMFAGIGVLGFFTAGIASEFIEYTLEKQRGMGRIRMKDHVILCNWNQLAVEIVHEIIDEGLPVMVLASLERSPMEDIPFVNGTGLHLADLERAHIRNAHSVIILAEKGVDDLASAIDAKSILIIMNIKKINPSLHVVVELLKGDSVENAKLAGANEILVWGDITAKLLARGVVDPGTIDIMETILTARSGEEIFEDMIDHKFEGKRYMELVQYMFDRNATPIALRGEKGLLVNPSKDYVVDLESVIYIAKERIKL